MEYCNSCGMPMSWAEKHDGINLSNRWCAYCCHEDGSHKSYDEVLNGMASFMLSDDCVQAGMEKSTNLDEAIARAKSYLLTMPAWSKR